MKKRVLPCLLAVTLLLTFWPSSAFAQDAWKFKGVDYDDIDEGLVENCIDFSVSPTGSLDSVLKPLNDYKTYLSTQPVNEDTQGKLALVNANIAEINASIASIENSTGQKGSAEDSAIIAARTLYITFNSLRDQYNELSRKQTVYNATLNNWQKQHDAGYVSDLQLSQIKEQGDALQSGMGTLQTQLDAVKRSFNTLLGRNYNYGLDMHSLPFARLDKISKIKFNADEKDAIANYQGDTSGEGFQNPDYDPDKGSFAASFRKLYDTMEDKNNLLAAEEKYLAVEQMSYNASKMQHDAKLLSDLDFISAQDKLDTENAKVKAAKTALFSAYEQYQWAIEFGVIN